MFRKMVETFISGAIGLAALYVVAKVAYEAGHDMAEVERRFEEQYESEDKSEDTGMDGGHGTMESNGKSETKRTENSIKPSKLGMFLSIRKFIGKGRASILGGLMQDPENHQLEAYVDEGEVHINIKKRRPGHVCQTQARQACMA